MGISGSMMALADNIVASNDMRIKAMSNLIANTRNMLNEFSSDRNNRSEVQKTSLNIFMKNLSGNVNNLLKEFRRNRNQMGETQTKNLADFVKTLDKEVNSSLNSFRKERKEESEKLKKKFDKEINDIRNNVKKLNSETNNLMNEYKDDMEKAHNIWHEMSAKLARSRKEGLTASTGTEESYPLVKEYIQKKRKKRKKIK